MFESSDSDDAEQLEAWSKLSTSKTFDGSKNLKYFTTISRNFVLIDSDLLQLVITTLPIIGCCRNIQHSPLTKLMGLDHRSGMRLLRLSIRQRRIRCSSNRSSSSSAISSRLTKTGPHSYTTKYVQSCSR